jgi:hypothetical protein
MKKKWMRWIVVGVCAGGLGLGLCAATAEKDEAAPSPDTRAARDKELQTMSKVIEDSLNQSGLGDWYGGGGVFDGLAGSPFEGKIRCDYYPTVGAIFRIPVNFALTEPVVPKKDEPKKTPAGEQDLWEKNAVGQAPSENVQIKVGTSYSFQGSNGNSYSFSTDDSRLKYDAKKVETLRKTLIETIGRYGNRLTSVMPDERILLVVESPSGGGNVLHLIGPAQPPAPPAAPAPPMAPPARSEGDKQPPATPPVPGVPPVPNPPPDVAIRYSESVAHSTGSGEAKETSSSPQEADKAVSDARKAVADADKAVREAQTPQEALAVVQQALNLAQHEIAKEAEADATDDPVEKAMGKAIAHSAVGMVQNALGAAQHQIGAAGGMGMGGFLGGRYGLPLGDTRVEDRYLLSFKKSDVSGEAKSFDQIAPKVEERRY